MLEEALQNYDGTVIVVSHDRYFIYQVANKIVEIRDGELRVYQGDVYYYLSKIEEERQNVLQEQFHAKKAAKAVEKRAKQQAKNTSKKS